MIRKLIFILFLAAAFTSHGQLTPTYEVNIPMRDGKFLAADIYVPASCNSCPTILIQTPYNKNLFRNSLPLGTHLNLQGSPYSWVIADWRGFYGSASANVAQPNRGQDGYDIIEWISDQSWSNDKVGTWGASALGVIQYQTAREQHPNHICAVPLVAHPQTSYDNYFYGGVLEKSRLQQLDALGYGLSPMVLANPYYSNTWQYVEQSTWYPEDIEIPMLMIGGWYDHNIDKMTEWYGAVRNSAPASVQDEQWFLVGPWVHGGTGIANVGSATQGELSYPDAAFKSDSMARDFFAHYLLGQSNGWESTDKITYYKLGDAGWGTSNAVNIAIASTDEILLNENGGMSSFPGTGSTAFVSDPRNPSPTLGGPTLSPGLNQGPYDQSSLEGRGDVRTFATAALTQEVRVSGNVKLKLFVESDQPDGDLTVRLTDVYPDGRNMLISDGAKRIRFRNGFTQASEAMMTSGQIYEVEVEIPFVNYTWKEGHKIKVYVGGNNSRRWDVNLQNGGTMYAAGDTNVANMKIHHNPQHPSRILLPGNNDFLAVNTLEKVPPLTVFPNPAGNDLYILAPDGTGDMEFEVLNSLGQIVKKGRSVGNKLDVSDLESGLYILRLQNSGIARFLKK